MTFNGFMDLCYLNIGAYGNQPKPKMLRAEILKIQEYIDLFINRVEFKGLPDEFNDISGKNNMFLYMLFFSPAIAFFKDDTLGLQALPVTGQFDYNIAGFPTKWTVFGFNGYKKDLNETNSVLMFNTRSFSIPYLHMLYNLEFMVENDMTHRQNLKAQRQPLILEMEEDEKKSANTFASKLNEFSDVIFMRKREKKDTKKGVDDNPYQTKTFESGKSFEGDKLASDYRYFDNRNLSWLGYNNENIEKKERLLVDEINSNNQVVDGMFTVAIDCMKESVNRINKMFGYNIQVVPKIMQGIKERNNDKSDSALQQRKTAEKLDS